MFRLIRVGEDQKHQCVSSRPSPSWPRRFRHLQSCTRRGIWANFHRRRIHGLLPFCGDALDASPWPRRGIRWNYGNRVLAAGFRESLAVLFHDESLGEEVWHIHGDRLELSSVWGKQQSLWSRQSFVPGSATNVQFMVKDSKKYATTATITRLSATKTSHNCV